MMKVFLLSMLMVTLYCLFVPTDGYAQEDTFDTFQEPAVKNNTDKKKKSKRRKSGFFFKDSGTGYRWSNGRNEIRLGGFLQLDSRTYFEDGIDLGKDNFLLRRIQPLLEVRLGKTYRFYILPSFSAAPGILDVYAEPESFNLRAGKFKAPFGLERLQSATALAFNERAFPTIWLPIVKSARKSLVKSLGARPSSLVFLAEITIAVPVCVTVSLIRITAV